MVSTAEWPRLGSELRPWITRLEPGLVSASVRRRHSGSYRAAVVPFIADRALSLPSRVAALAEEASNEIARFDAELGSDVAPFASVLLRSESASSSMIENLTSGARSIALAELGSREKHNATEIVGNVGAMTAALRLARNLDADAILAMHAALMADLHPNIAGQWREEQVGSIRGLMSWSMRPNEKRRFTRASSAELRAVLAVVAESRRRATNTPTPESDRRETDRGVATDRSSRVFGGSRLRGGEPTKSSG